MAYEPNNPASYRNGWDAAKADLEENNAHSWVVADMQARHAETETSARFWEGYRDALPDESQ